MLVRILVGTTLSLSFALASVYSASAESMMRSFDPALYRYFTPLSLPKLIVPTVVELPVSDDMFHHALLDDIGALQHTAIVSDEERPTVRVEVEGIQGASALTDGSMNTSADIPYRGTLEESVTFTLDADQSITTSALSIQLAQHVALPTRYELRASSYGGTERVVVAERPFVTTSLSFPRTSATEWYLTLWYDQPLRISEIELDPYGETIEKHSFIRFLAYPGIEYSLYSDSEGPVLVEAEGERPDLVRAEGVVRLDPLVIRENPQYMPVQSDLDSDGIVDVDDNCITVANPDQEDIDSNGRGDLCDDFDRDSREGSADNCPLVTNRMQTDSDADGIGDACDDYDNRFTERNAWVPWAGMFFAALVLIVLVILSLRLVTAENRGTNKE